MKKVKMFTDGSCKGNPGPGGWGTILQFEQNGKVLEKELSGGEGLTTNNRMELMAFVKGLQALKGPCEVLLTTDSKYLVDAMEKGWAEKWRAYGWVKADKKPALNADLWEKILDLTAKHQMTYCWVRGHAGHPENERCDKLANDAAYRNRGRLC